ncbi:MAG: flippase-like domain-containing protein [Oceanospirillaceae bacterium]|nr:flippase-like domain-containing protein [Oceanospirillaceae bacterium]
MSHSLRWVIASTIFALLLLAVEHYLGWASVLEQWAVVDPAVFTGLTLLTLISYLLRAERVYRYFGQRHGHPRRAYLRISFIHNALNNFLPMRLGEAAFPLLMRRQFRQSMLSSTAGLVWIRLMDLHVLLLLAALALGSLLPTLGYLALAGLIVGPVLVTRLRSQLMRLLPARFKAKAQELTHLLPHSSALVISTYLQTLLIWVVKLLALVLVLQAFLPIDFVAAWIAVTTADISGVLPIHGLAGSGTYEAAMLAALIPLGFAAEQALSAAINLHIYLLGVSALSVPLALLIPQGDRKA